MEEGSALGGGNKVSLWQFGRRASRSNGQGGEKAGPSTWLETRSVAPYVHLIKEVNATNYLH